MAHSARAQQALSPLSGFPEWLPAGRVVEQHFIDVLRHVFELHGFSGIQTRAVEPLSELTRKGETSKEVYLLSRLQADPAEAAGAAETDPAGRLGLHFDLTVPFARYVLDNAGVLHFPFKRYQIQKVWRGERPQEGRFREFYQVDIDVVGDGSLPPHYDAEIPLIMHQALSALPIPPVTIHVSNRKVAQGFYKSVGIGDEALIDVLRVVDKIDKIGPGNVAAELVGAVGATAAQADAALRLAGRGTDLAHQLLGDVPGADLVDLVHHAQDLDELVVPDTHRGVEALGHLAVGDVDAHRRDGQGGQGLVHDQGHLHVVVQGQGAVADDVDIGLDELPVAPLLGPLAAPDLLDLVALEGEVQGPCVVHHVAGEGDGEVEVQAQLLARVGHLGGVGLEPGEEVDLLGGLPLPGQLAQGLHGAGLNAAEAVELEGVAQGVEEEALHHVTRGEPLGEAGE